MTMKELERHELRAQAVARIARLADIGLEREWLTELGLDPEQAVVAAGTRRHERADRRAGEPLGDGRKVARCRRQGAEDTTADLVPAGAADDSIVRSATAV